MGIIRMYTQIVAPFGFVVERSILFESYFAFIVDCKKIATFSGKR